MTTHRSRRPAHAIFFFLCGFLFLPLMQSDLSFAEDAQSVQALTRKSQELHKHVDALLKRVLTMRTDELEKMRKDVLKKLGDLEEGRLDLNGQSLQVALRNAYVVAKGYGLDVARLKAIYDRTKRVIRRAEFAKACGTGLGTMREFTDPLKDTAGVGDVVQYFKLADKSEARLACAQRLKVQMYREVSLEFLRALTSSNAAVAAAALRRYSDAVRNQLTGSDVEAIQADLKALADEQSNVAMFLSIVPLVGDAMDAISLKEGEDITGQKLSALESTFNAIMLLAPNAVEMAVKRLGKGGVDSAKWLVDYLKKVAETDGTVINAAARKAGASADAVKGKARALLARLGETAPARAVTQAGKIAKAATETTIAGATAAAERWTKSADGAKAMAVWQAAKRAGKSKVARIKKLLAEGTADQATLLKAYQDLRMDKLALSELQGEEYRQLRTRIKTMEDDLFGSVTTRTIKSDAGDLAPVVQQVRTVGKVDRDAMDGVKAALKGDTPVPPQLQAALDDAKNKMRSKARSYAGKYGVPPGQLDADKYLDFDNLDITVFNATNKPPALDKVGFDRDITYRVKIPEKKVTVKNPKTGLMETITVPPREIDLPAEIVSPYYDRSLYKHLNPDKAPPKLGSKRLKEYGEQMDHVVTDEYSVDAYRIGTDVRQMFKDNTVLARLPGKGGDIGDTVVHKSREWFQKADDIGVRTGQGMRDIKEGMRQATKQYDSYAVSLQKYYDPKSIAKVPPKLKNGLGIFKQVEQGAMSVPEAEQALKALGTNKEEVVDLFGSYLQGMLKSGKRKVKSGGFGRVQK